MTRAILWERPEEAVPERAPSLRLDLAWPLFLPHWKTGTIPEQQPRMLTLMGRWIWESLGQMAGRLRADAPTTVWLVAPPLSSGAREYVTRLASFWCDEVYWEYPVSENRWTPPTMKLDALPDTPLWRDMTETSPEGTERYLAPVTGIGRAYMKVQEVVAGSASARLHSHTAQDEYYVILKGSGTLRMGRHTTPVEPGTLIAKPTGPDLPSHIVADKGEAVTILDIEVYPDARLWLGTYDLMAYPDHGELLMEGPGWENMVPQQAIQRTEDVYSHYFTGYVRQADGTVADALFPGHPPRSETDPYT